MAKERPLIRWDEGMDAAKAAQITAVLPPRAAPKTRLLVYLPTHISEAIENWLIAIRHFAMVDVTGDKALTMARAARSKAALDAYLKGLQKLVVKNSFVLELLELGLQSYAAKHPERARFLPAATAALPKPPRKRPAKPAPSA